MKHKSFYILLIFIGFINSSFSQENIYLISAKPSPQMKLNTEKTTKSNDMVAGFFYIPGLSFHKKMYWNSLQNFFNYYNSTMSSQLAKPIGQDFRFKNGFTQGVEGFIQALTMNVIWTRLNAETSSILKNNEQQIIDINFRNIYFGWELVVPIKFFGIGGVWGWNQYRGEFMSGHRYPFNNYTSYAQDNTFNGIYSTRSIGSFILGGRLNLNFNVVNIIFKFQKVLENKISSTSTKLLPLYDRLAVTASGGQIYSDGGIRKEFPFSVTGTGYNYLSEYPRGWYFSVHVGIGISNVND